MKHSEGPACECSDCVRDRDNFAWDLIQYPLSRETKVKMIGLYLAKLIEGYEPDYEHDHEPDQDEEAESPIVNAPGSGEVLS